MKFLLFIFCLALILKPAFSQIDHAGSGRGLYFDGSNDFVDFGDILDDLGLPFSVSAWIKVDPGKTGHSPIFVSQDNHSLYNGFWLVINTTNLFVGYGDGKGYNNPAFRREKTARHPNVYGKWTHVCAVVRGAQDMDLYVNGVDIGGDYTGSSNLPMASNYSQEVAKAGYWVTNDVTHQFKGHMDDVRVWSYALGEAQIREQMCKKLTGSETGLLGYWTFDEIEGDVVSDLGPHGFDGTLMNSLQRVYSGAPIGDASIQTYGNIQSASFEQIETKVISGSPIGVHLYKVLHPPSQTSGLSNAEKIGYYYGAFFVNPNGNTFFQLENCPTYNRQDNSGPLWSNENVGSFQVRVEAVFGESAPVAFELGPPINMCEGETLTLSSGVQNSDVSFRWNTGETTSEIYVTETGLYKLTISAGCSVAKDSVEVLFTGIIQPFDLGEDLIKCPEQTIDLRLELDPGGKNVLWSNGATGTAISINEAGTYKVTVSNECGSFEDSIRILEPVSSVRKELPNVITPNGDGFNQKFLARESEVGNVSIFVFNRWGREIYADENYQNTWDGSGLSPGTYFYVLKDECGELTKGMINILY